MTFQMLMPSLDSATTDSSGSVVRGGVPILTTQVIEVVLKTEVAKASGSSTADLLLFPPPNACLCSPFFFSLLGIPVFVVLKITKSHGNRNATVSPSSTSSISALSDGVEETDVL